MASKPKKHKKKKRNLSSEKSETEFSRESMTNTERRDTHDKIKKLEKLLESSNKALEMQMQMTGTIIKKMSDTQEIKLNSEERKVQGQPEQTEENYKSEAEEKKENRV